MSASLVNNLHFENWSSNHVSDWLKGKAIYNVHFIFALIMLIVIDECRIFIIVIA